MTDIGTMRVKSGLADMLKGGVIMDVTNAEQAKIAEDAGACAVMALERVPSDIRAQGGVARMADPTKIQEIQACVSVPVMAKARKGFSGPYGLGTNQFFKGMGGPEHIYSILVGFTGETEYNAAQPDGTPRKLLDTTRINKLGWQPRLTLAKGLGDAYASYLRAISFC